MSDIFFIASFRLGFLRNFLDRVAKDACAELDEIEKRNVEGAFSDLVGFENAINYPWARFELATKTVMYELNVLVEARLHVLAEPAWLRQCDSDGPKRVDQLVQISAGSLAAVRMVSDLNLRDVIGFIEAEYAIKLQELNGWAAFASNRKAINDLRHRDGRKHNRDIEWGSKDIIAAMRQDPNFNEAERLIDRVEVLLKELYRISPSVGC